MYAGTDTTAAELGGGAAGAAASLDRRRAGRSTPVEPEAVERVRAALTDLAAGRPVVVAGDEGEADLVVAAELAEPAVLAFVVRHTAGFVRVALLPEDADRLDLPLLPGDGGSGFGQCVAVDAREGIGTGISATDRAATIRLLGSPGTTPENLSRPGHVVPVRVRADGVLGHRGRTEAAVDLAALAGLTPAAALSALVSPTDARAMARAGELQVFAGAHGVRLVTVADLVTYRLRFSTLVERRAEAAVPLPAGRFTAVGYSSRLDGAEHLALVHGALVHGELGDGEDVLVHLHRECPVGDLLGSAHCGCGRRLAAALDAVVREGRGVVVYLRRGAADVVRDLLGPHPDDAEPAQTDRVVADQVLRDLGVRSARRFRQEAAVRA